MVVLNFLNLLALIVVNLDVKKTKDVEKLYPIEERQQGIHNDTKRINKL